MSVAAPEKPAVRTVADVLNDAADYIEEYGLLQGTIGVHGGPRCAMGALASASYTDDYQLALNARHAFADYIESKTGHRGITTVHGGLTTWNDQFVDSPEEVVAAFRAAALLDPRRR